MNQQHLEEIIKDPSVLDPEKDLQLLKQLIEDFPYFPGSYTMLCKLLKNEHSIYLDKYLKLAAAYVGDREVFYHYLHQENTPTSIEGIPIPEEVIAFEQENEGEINEEAKIEEVFTREPIPAIEALNNLLPAMGTLDYFAQHKPSYVENRDEGQGTGDENEISNTEYRISHTAANGNIELNVDPIVEDQVDETASFSGWLDKLKAQPASAPKKSIQLQAPTKSSSDDLISNFIRTQPRIKRPEQGKFFNPEDNAQKSITDDASIASETLANIYIKQGIYNKAIEVYERLCLNFPLKKAYFAEKIEEVRKLTK